MSNANYLTLYPRLAAFISQHPEVAHNPVFFIGLPDEYNRNSRVAESFGRSMERIVTPMMVAGVVIAMIGILAWVIRAIMNHRRWLRVSKLQTDMQNKLLERFTSNEEMLGFIQTSAGQRFLESASVAAGRVRVRSAHRWVNVLVHATGHCGSCRGVSVWKS
jgi:hypothetical protein